MSGGLGTLRPAPDLSASTLVTTADTMFNVGKASDRNRLLVSGADGG